MPCQSVVFLRSEMGKRKMTPEDEIKWLNQRATDKRISADRKNIAAILIANDYAVPEVKRCLADLGLWPKDNELNNVPALGVALSSACKEASAPVAPANHAKTAPDASVIDPIPTKYNTIAFLGHLCVKS